ncbi:hypothetical protein JK635_02085 [Neobacillus sp. YIM B02564]|uniref:Uncharacterized protein n=1 Tax=Neobacillus paridis TaxID=2803862 RepID=A0ABS1TKI6_9BACI|nr:hypothetical protein [Neobacillus paridis]MBL4951028.1 hypothetical protein [Neobacillus paridis]
MTKQYQFIEPEETKKEMVNVLVKGLERALTDQEIRIIYWLSECEYQTRGVILDLFKELSEKKW